jgi:D-alanyl-D-alanine carboxypeptidase/D-alanyl-D-alanine-endopeptidase (penicillin-binding protein 4)
MEKTIIILAAFLLGSSCATVRPGRDPAAAGRAETIQDRLDSLLSDSTLAPSFIGIKVVTLEHGKTLYERNSRKLFHPASNMKLLTTAAAINLLDSSFTFRTEVSSDSRASGGILTGNIYVRGTGDPLLSTKDLDSLAARLRRNGITAVNGDIVGDVTRFDSISWGPGWMWDDEPDRSEAFITPLTVNDNVIEFTAYPGRRNGETVAILYDAPEGCFTVRNEAVTSADTMIPAITITRRRGENVIEARGRIAPLGKPYRSAVSVWRPETFFLDLFRRELSRAGIAVLGRTRIGAPGGPFILGEVYHPLDSVLHRINKESDNLAAENTLKTLAAEKGGIPGSTAGGISFLKLYLSSIGVDTTAFTAADGSGASFYNEVSPDIIVTVLRRQCLDRSIFRRFSESLPVAAVDGTLKNRMKGTAAENNVRAKTGTIAGVSTLSGYVTTRAGVPLAFSIMCNHFPGDIKTLRSLQDSIMVCLAGLGGDTVKPGE